MAKGDYLVQGDETTCGGKIVDGASDYRLSGKTISRVLRGFSAVHN